MSGNFGAYIPAILAVIALNSAFLAGFGGTEGAAPAPTTADAMPPDSMIAEAMRPSGSAAATIDTVRSGCVAALRDTNESDNADDHDAGDSPPLSVRIVFRSTGGERITGTLTAWDAMEITGSFGTYTWRSIETRDAWRIHVALMDRDSGEDWLRLGRIMLDRDDGRSRAETAFARARTIDPSITADHIDAIRKEVAAAIAERRATEQATRDAKLRDAVPEAADFPATPWPHVAAQDALAHRAELARFANEIAATAGRALRAVPAQHAVLRTDVEPAQAAATVALIGDVHTYLDELLPAPPASEDAHDDEGDDEPAAPGGDAHESDATGPDAVAPLIEDRRRVAVVVFRDFDAYQLAAARHFDRLASQTPAAVAHYRDAHAIVIGWQHPDPKQRDVDLVRAIVFAFMHRYVSAARLPMWAHEGLALHVAAAVLDDQRPITALHNRALSFIRTGGDLRAIVGAGYGSALWAQDAETVRAVGMLLTTSLIRARPAQFIAWVESVKRSALWQDAFHAAFNMRIERFLDHSVAWFAVND